MMQRGLQFGWPLLIANILLFGVFQGDKLIVGRVLGLETLALFAMGVTLTLSPMLVSASSEKQFFLPQLSSSKNADAFSRLANAAMQASIINGLGLVTLITLTARPLVDVLLGERYAALTPLLVLFAIWQAMRVFKVGGIITALSKAQTGNTMIANGIRILSLPVAWYVATTGGTLAQIIWVAIIGEAMAYAVSLALVRWRLGLKLNQMVLPILAACSLLAVAACTTVFPTLAETMFIGKGLVVVLFFATLASTKALRSYLAQG